MMQTVYNCFLKMTNFCLIFVGHFFVSFRNNKTVFQLFYV